MIYISSSCIQRERIDQILQTYVEHGITNIELSGGTKYYPEIERDLLKYKEQNHINYVCHAYFPPPPEDFVVNLASCNQEIYEKSIMHYMNCIEMLKKLDCHVLSIHAGFYIEILPNQIGNALYDTVVYDKEEALIRFCEAYKRIENVAAQYDIEVYLENNVLSYANYERFHQKNHLMMTDYEGYLELKRKIDFNLLLDVGHLYVSANTLQKDFKEQCCLFQEHVKWLHVSENNGIADEHRALDEKGEIVREVEKLIKTCRNITLETSADMDEIKSSIAIVEKVWKA